MSDVHPDTSIKLEYWGSAEYWTWEEFEYLAVGIDPYKIQKIDREVPLDLKEAERRRIREHLKFHCRADGTLFGKMHPCEGVEFAKRADIVLPAALVDAVARRLASSNLDERRELAGPALRANNKLLQILLGVAIAKYGFEPHAERQSSISDMASDLEGVGLPTNAKTIKTKLTEAYETLNGEQEDKIKRHLNAKSRKL